MAGIKGVAAGTHYNALIGRILPETLGPRSFDETDKVYVVREISSRTGLAEADAQKRLDDTVATLKAQAETARRYAVLFAFLTAASLLISGLAAWWAATAGGKHRDDGVAHCHPHFFRNGDGKLGRTLRISSNEIGRYFAYPHNASAYFGCFRHQYWLILVC